MAASARTGLLGCVAVAVALATGCAASQDEDEWELPGWQDAGSAPLGDAGAARDARGGDEPVEAPDGAPDAGTSKDGGSAPVPEAGAADAPLDAGGDAPAEASPEASPSDAAADGAATGCQYTTVFQQAGPVLTVGSDVDQVYYWSTQPLAEGAGFYCMKVDFDMQTADTLAGLGGPDAGCPIYTLVTGVHGTGPEGTPPSQAKLMAGALFKFYTTSCVPGTHRIELDTAWSGDTVQGPWNLGDTFHFTIEVKPFTSTVTLTQNGVAVGPAITASITGATVADTVNPKIDFGDPAKGGGSNWPNYGAVYSNVVIQADVAP